MSLSQSDCQVLLDCAVDSDDDIQLLLNESDDEELFLKITDDSEISERNSISNHMEDVVPLYTETEFRKHFRVEKSLFKYLTKEFEISEIFQNLRPDKRINASSHIALFLWFAGHKGCTFMELSHLFHFSTSTVSRIMHRTILFLCELSTEIIRWPTDELKAESNEYFKNKIGFPGVIGAIDVARISVDAQSCAKDFSMESRANICLALQAISDHRKKFIDIYVGFPGTCKDSLIFQKSPIYTKLSEDCADDIILGDSAYPCMKNLITPYAINYCLNQAQKRFNIKLKSGRVVIEQAISVLLQRFPQLYLCKLRGVEKLSQFIRACCVLHNLANENDLDFSEEYIAPTSDRRRDAHVQDLPAGIILRDKICKELTEKG